MSSKTSGTMRFWRYVALLAIVAVEFGCGGGGGGTGGGGGNPVDTTAPNFAGLQAAEFNQTTDSVEVTAAEASDGETPKSQLVYLIYVSDQPTVDKNTITPQTFTGANCANGQCRFPLTGLKTDGTTTYRFASNAKDNGGHIDADAHPAEGGLTITPLIVSTQPIGGGNGGGSGGGGGGGIVTSASLNANTGLHAVHPTLAVVGDQRYVIWEECTPAPSSTTTGGITTSTPGWDKYHPCDHSTASKIYVRQGANWDLLTDPALGGRTDLTREPASHGHNPTLIHDGTNLYASWKERSAASNLFVLKFDGTTWSDTLFPDTASDDRPALTRHPILGTKLGMAYERSAAAAPGNKQLSFRQFTGTAWETPIGPLNKNSTVDAEAPVFSKKGETVYITWKEATQAAPSPEIPNIFVKGWNVTSSNWEDVGGALNIDSTKEARYPSIDVLNNVPYVVWHECFDADCSREHIFVRHWDGTQWIQDKDTGACGTDPNCGSLNVNSRFAETPSLAIFNGKVYVTWSERDTNTNKFAVRIKRLDGNTWVPLTLPQGLFVNNARSPMLFANGTLNIAWVEENEAGVLQLVVAKLG